MSCHLEIQGHVVLERVYVEPHTPWFQPFAAAYYASVYLCETCGIDLTWKPTSLSYAFQQAPQIPLARVEGLSGPDGYPHMHRPGFEVTREEAVECMDFLLALELAEAYR